MVSDTIFELCLPVLRDEALDEDEKTDKLEEVLRKGTSLQGRPLQDAILGVLWRHRDATTPMTASPPPRHVLIRRGSPAPWQVPRATTPLASPSLATASPVSSHGFAGTSAMSRVKSSTASPFTSPRPSPRPSYVLPLPQSPNLHNYEFIDPASSQGDYGDLGSDTIDWLVNDDEPSRPTSSSATSAFESNLSAAATPWVQPQPQVEMSPYDMLRSILGESRTDEEIEAALEANSYDLSATLMAFMGAGPAYDDNGSAGDTNGSSVGGKISSSSQPIAIGNPRNPVLCKYWVATGSCLRADCRFSHEYGTHLCKYWIEGNCLAGDSCVFSHDPSAIVANLNLGGRAGDSGNGAQPTLQVQDYDAFPALQAAGVNNWAQNQYGSYSPAGNHRSLANASASPRSFGSRPNSRHSSRAPTPSLPQVDDNDAFPALGAGGKASRKHHGKRGGHGHAHANKEALPDAVRMSPSTTPSLLRKGLAKSRSYIGRDPGGLASNIAPPEHVPWLESGDRVNPAYIKARQDAFKHSGLRNKFLQSAAQAWNRQDARAAKALSLRGQSENDLMRKAHREAARVLYEAQAQAQASASPGSEPLELYVDLHGLHPEEAIAYLARVLREQRGLLDSKAETSGGEAADKAQTNPQPLYAITGTGHHSKGGKDKVGKAIRGWLGERGFAFREFSVPGDRGNVGGILGIDIKSGDPDSKGTGPRTPGTQGRFRMEERGDGSSKSDSKDEDDVTSEKGGSATADEVAKPQRPVMEMKIPTGPRGLRT